MRRRAAVLAAVSALALFTSATFASAALPAGPRLAADGDPVLMAAGDIACRPSQPAFKGGNGTATKCRQKYTAMLLAGADWVLPLGDEQYEDGTLAEFNASYDLSWGAYTSNSRPVPGNHEYQTPGAAGYYAYFGAVAGAPATGYYAWDAGAWRLLALNSSVSMARGSAQYNWIENELATHANACVAAYWHEPRFRSGKSNVARFKPVWNLLYQYGADLVLNGHSHTYQRFAPLDPGGNIDRAQGLRQIIAGTGGKGFSGLLPGGPEVEASQNHTYGVLRLTLHAGSYDWEFVPEAGKTWTDSGTTACH